jgi:putative membrane protein
MLVDFLLAATHHLLVLLLVTLVAMEFALVRDGMTERQARLVAKIDGYYGLVAVLVVIAGICRILFGANGYEYYVANTMFWLKMAAYIVMGLLSLPPTLAFLRWRRAMERAEMTDPPAAEVRAVRRWMLAEVHVLAVIAVLAAALGRGHGG